MKWENLGTHRLSDLRVMSGDKINQKLRIFRIQKFFWFTFRADNFFLILKAPMCKKIRALNIRR